jgi:transcription elongation GreA/GreB family factor
MKNIKEELYQNCKRFVEEKLKTVNQIMTSNQTALQSETKSSAGDKHETGRAMLQLEMEKASQQFESINKMQITLNSIRTGKNSKIVGLGNIVYTTLHNYYISISIGEILVEDKKYYAISPFSPIGKILLGKQKGDKIIFNGKEFLIKDIY